MPATLHQRRILVVEDDYFQADDLCRTLARAGAVILGPTSSIERALELATGATQPDAAVLDVNITGRTVLPVADALAARAVPFLFLTGYDQWAAPERFGRTLICRKSMAPELVLESIGRFLRT